MPRKLLIIALLCCLATGCEDQAKPPGPKRRAPTRPVPASAKAPTSQTKPALKIPRGSLDLPTLADSDLIKQIDKQTDTTQTTHVTPNGLGGGPKSSPWPALAEGERVRFIRLKYRGGDWDRGMGRGADHNLLLKFAKASRLPVARDTEAVEIRLLRKFPRRQAPPFVYLTGTGPIQLTKADIETLRWYCLEEGGMIFADCGSRKFHQSFSVLCRGLFPLKRRVEIANDDPIFRVPFIFLNGAPPLLHHGGNRALGIRHKGRWVVFYHPGDLNDAWKTGHSGLKPDLVDQAYYLGINVMYYAFTQYMQGSKTPPPTLPPKPAKGAAASRPASPD